MEVLDICLKISLAQNRKYLPAVKILFSLFCPRKWAMKKETASALFSIDIEQKSVEYENGPI